MSDDKDIEKFQYFTSVHGVYYPKDLRKNIDFFKKILKFLFNQKLISIKDKILVTALLTSSGNRMNLIQIHEVGDLKLLGGNGSKMVFIF